MVPTEILIIISLLSGLIGALISTYFYIRYEKRKFKLDTLRRLAATRFAITVKGTTEESRNEFFAVFNEIFVVFHDAPKVLNALEQLNADRNRPERMSDNFVKLFKAMTDHLKISHKSLTDSFFLNPFVPGQAIKPPTKIG